MGGGVYMSKIIEELEDLTSSILLNNDMYKIPVDVLKIANNYNINVYQGDLDKSVSGAIRYIKEDKVFEILLNKNDTKTRQRFTLAHELGHYFLDKELFEDDEIHIDTLYRGTKSDEKNVEYFAGALLMNKTLLEKIYNENKTITELAELFDVSISAMTVRLDILGLL